MSLQEEKSENTIKVSLYQEDNLIIERIFDANFLSPSSRKTLDIRGISPLIINKLQRNLSKSDYDQYIDVGDNSYYALFDYKEAMLNGYSKKYREGMDIKPEIKKQDIDGKIVKGVEFKFRISLNKTSVFEKLFYVMGYRDEAKYSVDIYHSISEITNQISQHLKKADVNNIWGDYLLASRYYLTPEQIQALPPEKRFGMIKYMN